MSERMSYQLFKNKRVMELHNPASQFKTHFKGIKLMNFLRYPFLLDLHYLNVCERLMVETVVDGNSN